MSWRKPASVMVALATAVSALTACNPDQKAQSKASGNGMVANLNGGGFSSAPNPQKNYNPFLDASNLTPSYTFEPLFVINGYDCGVTPWLGTKYAWTDPTHLTVNTRPGVTWSDGQPFSASDVAYTFNLVKKNPAFDKNGVWLGLKSAEAQGNDTVVFTLKKPSAETFSKISEVMIVPEHIWSKVPDPVKFTNPSGVGTGPFTYKDFNGQQLILARNPKYWQANKVKVQQLTFTNNGGGGDADKLRLANGQYDWNGMFISDIQKTYVSRDPQHNKYWFPPGADISLYLNLTKTPFDDVNFRRAIAYGIDRNEISKKAENGYVQPASQTGLVLPGQKSFLPPQYANGAVIPYDVAKAKQMFQAAGYKYDGSGKLLGKDGKPMSFTFKVQAGFLDWIQAANIVKSDLAGVGIKVDVRTGDPGDVENDRSRGEFEMALGVQGGTCNMYQNFDEPYGSERTAPIGKPAAPAGAGGNFVRWNDARTDQLLDQLKVTTDLTKQKQIVAGLTDIAVQQVPTIPLWYGAQWYQYRTAKAIGWPSQEHPYASPNGKNNPLLVITHLTPPTG